MAFVFLIIGAVILISGVRGTQDDLFKLVQGDFDPSLQQAGQSSFIPWVLAILIIGAVGYVKQLRSLSHGFMALVIIAMIIKAYKVNPNIFQQFNSALGINSSGVSGGTTGGLGVPLPSFGAPDPNHPPPGYTFNPGNPDTGKGAGFFPVL